MKYQTLGQKFELLRKASEYLKLANAKLASQAIALKYACVGHPRIHNFEDARRALTSVRERKIAVYSAKALARMPFDDIVEAFKADQKQDFTSFIKNLLNTLSPSVNACAKEKTSKKKGAKIMPKTTAVSSLNLQVKAPDFKEISLEDVKALKENAFIRITSTSDVKTKCRLVKLTKTHLEYENLKGNPEKLSLDNLAKVEIYIRKKDRQTSPTSEIVSKPATEQAPKEKPSKKKTAEKVVEKAAAKSSIDFDKLAQVIAIAVVKSLKEVL